jgi:hypothetical protein
MTLARLIVRCALLHAASLPYTSSTISMDYSLNHVEGFFSVIRIAPVSRASPDRGSLMQTQAAHNTPRMCPTARRPWLNRTGAKLRFRAIAFSAKVRTIASWLAHWAAVKVNTKLGTVPPFQVGTYGPAYYVGTGFSALFPPPSQPGPPYCRFSLKLVEEVVFSEVGGSKVLYTFLR